MSYRVIENACDVGTTTTYRVHVAVSDDAPRAVLYEGEMESAIGAYLFYCDRASDRGENVTQDTRNTYDNRQAHIWGTDDTWRRTVRMFRVPAYAILEP